MLKISGLNVTLGKKEILKDINLNIRAHSVTAVIGKNGVEQVVELPLTEEELATFHECCNGVRKNMEHLKDI